MNDIHYVADEGWGITLEEESAKSEGVKKGLGMIVAFVGMVLVPYASPAIAGAVGMTAGTMGFTAVSALSGAAIGAGLSAAGGGDPWIGALGGAIGGFGAGAAATGAGTVGTGVAGSPIEGSAGLSQMGSAVSKANVAPTFSGAGPSFGSGTGAGVNMAQALGGTGGAAPNTGWANDLVSGLNTTATSQPTGLSNLAKPQAVPQAGVTTRNTGATTTGNTNRLNDVAARMFAGAFAGDPYADATAEQRAMLEAQRRRDEEVRRLRMDTATRLLDEAKYFDPQEGGRRAALDVKQRVGAEEEATAREEAARSGYNTGRRRIAKQRAGVAAGRGAAQAFAEGADRYQGMKLSTTQAALGWLPSDSPDYWRAIGDITQGGRDNAANQINDTLGWYGYGTTPIHRPTVPDQWPTDNVGITYPGG